MKGLIGNTLIAKLTPKPKQYDIRDTRLPGFLIRVNPSGKMLYVCQYKRGRRVTLGRVDVITPAQARDMALAVLGDAAKGIDPQKKKPDIITLQEFIKKEYAPWFNQHRKSGTKSINDIIRCFLEPFGKYSLEKITPILVDQWRTQRLKNNISPQTINRNITGLKAALSKAVLWEFISKHPLEKLKQLKSDHSIKVRYLSHEEEKRLRDVAIQCDCKIKNERTSANQWRKERGYETYSDLTEFEFADHVRPMILLSINTGLRQGKVFSLRWDNINFSHRLLTIEGSHAKSGKTRHIPLNSEALHVLKSWQQQSDNSDLVFPSIDNKRFNTVKTSWGGILKTAKINNFRWHDMRHHFASKLVMAGVDLNTVRELLGHSDLKMTLRYAHLAPEHKANAVEKLVSNIEFKKAI